MDFIKSQILNKMFKKKSHRFNYFNFTGRSNVCCYCFYFRRLLAAISFIFHLLISQYFNGINELCSTFIFGILFSCHGQLLSKSLYLLLHE